jgi:hypothetical protein
MNDAERWLARELDDFVAGRGNGVVTEEGEGIESGYRVLGWEVTCSLVHHIVSS